ncbi:MAG TPA: hypothetical protein VFF52_04030 [Isosphaeraceae bacterium]|nr:hypothetical protein [Isosphaeraceae bacterium]
MKSSAERLRWWVPLVSALVVVAGLAAARAGAGQEPAEKTTGRWCFAWTPALPKGAEERAALVKGAKWPSASKITISFLDGDPVVQRKVMEQAVKWTREAGGPANLIFEFRRDGPTDIRISFKNPGSWSVIGTGCRQIVDPGQPTMNFGWLDPATDETEYRRVVLHEFGHAIGLIHEHQNPAGGIQWNQVQVVKDLSGPPNNWSIPVISHNMFEPYAAHETNFTKVDSKSIMMYPIPANWTLNQFSAGLNTDLSDLDKAFVREQYP